MDDAPPILLDLYCGRGGWSQVAKATGWQTIGIDHTDQPAYPGRFIRQSLPVTPSQLLTYHPTLIVASPPCEEYARHHLPWLKGPAPDTSHMAWCLALADQMPCPVIVECSRFASWHFPGSARCGSFHLWGNVPTLLPTPPRNKSTKTGENAALRAVIPADLAEAVLSQLLQGAR